MRNGSIQKTILLLLKIFGELDIQVSLIKVEQIAIMVHKAMTLQARNYHSLDHVFSLTNGLHPLQDLTALFHDIVYYQVDRELISEIHQLIAPYLDIKDENHICIKSSDPGDRILDITLDVFNLRYGQVITPSDGSNEFLSSLVMNKCLEGILTEAQIIICSACIEATIPFRMDQRSHPLILEDRIIKSCERRKIDLSSEQIYSGVAFAVNLANKDVGGFCVSDPGLFLNDTWKLLPETNISLRAREYYTIKEYRSALQKMEAFFRFLKPEFIYQMYRGEPAEEKWSEMTRAAANNIETARSYLGIKLVGIAVIEAFAELSGGDAPISLFMGEIEDREGEARMEDFLPRSDFPDELDNNSTIFRLLEYGRTDESSFDMKNSPLSAYIYRQLDQSQVNELVLFSKQMFTGAINAHDFIQKVNHNIIETLVKACSALAITRKNKLSSLL